MRRWVLASALALPFLFAALPLAALFSFGGGQGERTAEAPPALQSQPVSPLDEGSSGPASLGFRVEPGPEQDCDDGTPGF
jgi:hypothetical protein